MSLEHDHQAAVFDVLRLNERQYPFLRWIYAIPNGGFRHKATSGRLWAEGVKRGISDICIPFPSRNPDWDTPFYGAYIEMKSGKNTLTPEQAEFLVFIKKENYGGKVAYTADEALDFIEDYCNLTLRARRERR